MSNIPPPPPWQPGSSSSPPPAQPLGYQPPTPYGVTVQCPRCGDVRAKKVGFTWWGGALGPRLLSHVKCLNCGSAFNGKTGQPNTTGIVIYTIISLVIGLAIAAAFLYMRHM